MWNTQYWKQVGGLTVIPKPSKRNTIPEDFGIEPEYRWNCNGR